MSEEMEIRSVEGTLLWAGAAESLRSALERAVASGANLYRTNLHGVNLRGADLRGADLSGADLRGADLSGAKLRGANLSEANLNGADLRWANLSEANLSEANLSEANLSGANLSGANLREADLLSIREDLYMVLGVARAEAPDLLTALREGRVNGSVYEGQCACLIGTIANIRGESYDELGINLRPDSFRPAEAWFLAIGQGDTPATSPIVAITVGWIEEWLREHGG
jgi:hypothetical protein